MKAPIVADDQMKVSGYNVKPAAVVVLIGANDYGFAERSPLGAGVSGQSHNLSEVAVERNDT